MADVFLKLFNMSVAAGWLILAVMLLRLVFRRAPKSIRCLLWALVGVRLVCPFSLESLLSLVPSAETVPADILYSNSPAIHTGISALNTAVNPALSASLAPAAAASVNPMQAIVYIASVVWLCGVAALLLYAVISYARLRRRVATAVPLRGNIRQSERVSSPFVLGLVRPRIYLPFGMDEESMGHVVAHETAHIRRRDHWIKPFGFLLLAVYWFNPLVWLAYVLLCRDIELACDERVVGTLGDAEKRAYSGALLACSVGRKAVAACPLAFGEAGVKQRVRNVLNYKRPAFWVVALALVSCAAVAVCFLTNPVKDAGTLPDVKTLRGVYAFDSVVYMNPLSSYYPFEGTGLLYELNSVGLAIVDEETGEIKELVPVSSWDRRSFTDADWQALFQMSFSIPEPGDADSRTFVALSDKYRLYEIGGELWLAELKSGYVWSIYSLRLTDRAPPAAGALAASLAPSPAPAASPSPSPALPSPAPLLAVTSDGETAAAYENLLWASTYEDGVWLSADAMSVFDDLGAVRGAVPTFTLRADLGLSYPQNVTVHGVTVVSAEGYETLYRNADPTYLTALPEGTYYVAVTVSRQGDYKAAAGDWERTGYECVFRLRVDENSYDHMLMSQPAEGKVSVMLRLTQDLGNYGYVAPEDQAGWAAALARAAEKASKSGALWLDNEVSLGLWIVWQGQYWQFTENEALINAEAGRVAPKDAAEVYALMAPIAEKYGVRLFRPEMLKNLGPFASATLDCGGRHTVTDPDTLARLEAMLSGATELRGGSACPFAATLTLETAGGRVILAMATDSCAVYMVNGVCFDYAAGNNADFFSLFGVTL